MKEALSEIKSDIKKAVIMRVDRDFSFVAETDAGTLSLQH